MVRESAEELATKAQESGAEFVVLTGGEPTVHDLNELVDALHQRDIPVHLETCGAFEIKGKVDWITLSPKWQALPLKENLAMASEMKIIVESSTSIEDWIRGIGPMDSETPVWLHPEWSQRSSEAVLSSITEKVKTSGKPYRAGIQSHKFYKADLLDPNSRDAAPLGGDPELGY